jgi:N6-L-threonylcarbamoyladenine synthase
MPGHARRGRCDRRDRRARADRWRHGRAGHGQGAGARRGQAADRGQPSRRPCAVARLSDPDLAFPICCCSSRAGIASCCWSRVLRLSPLATTIDDAAGEAFDKTAKLLGLGFPRRPAVERPPSWAIPRAVPLPRPLVGSAEPHFSFAGLKSAVARARDTGQYIAPRISPRRSSRPWSTASSTAPAPALRPVDGVTALVVAGGVAANAARSARALQAWRRRTGMRFVAPPLWLCTDNAAMIAWAGAERFAAGLTDPLDVPARPRWPLDPGAEQVRGAGVKA